jgi:ATP-dependent DNA helicase RecQ
VEPGDPEDPAFAALRTWRLERARADAVPPYVVFHDATLRAIADAMPATRGELAAIRGLGPAKLERYGDEVLAVIEQV